MVGVGAPEFAHRLHRAGLHQAAARLAIRHYHDPAGIQRFGRFRHEPHAAERDYVAFALARLASQFEAVADHVGEFLNLGHLVVVRQQNRPALLLKLQDLPGYCGFS